MTTLIPVPGDQLSPGLSSLAGMDRADCMVLMTEVADETTCVRHHKTKIAYILSAMRRHADRIVVAEAGEWRVAAMLDGWQTLFGVPVDIRADTRFPCTHCAFAAWADGRAALTMAFFYRRMRAATGLLARPDTGAAAY